ncbi:unnamed protein product [Camellia sinensis]
MNVKYDQMANGVFGNHPETMEAQVRSDSPQSSSFFNTRYARIDFPRFFGEDATGWLYKCERFFDYNSVESANKVKLATLHLEDKALQWYQWFEKCHRLINWDLFKQGIISRFGPNSYEDAMGDLTKLKQTTTVKEYQEQFEILANRTCELPEVFFISCFISGLREDIKAGVLMFRPTTIVQAIGLAKMQENSIEAITRRARQGNRAGESIFFHQAKQNPVMNPKTMRTDPLPVLVADGTKLMSTAICKGFRWEMQGTEFQADMRILQLKGCDMVLGIQWLATLGPVKWDFKNLSMEFQLNDKRHVLRGGKKEELTVIGANKIKKIVQKQAQGVVAQVYSFQAECDEIEETLQPDLEPDLEALLVDYGDIFQEPKTLPPTRSHDHCIPLKTGAEPTNIRPYRCGKENMQSWISDPVQGILTYKGKLLVAGSIDARKDQGEYWQVIMKDQPMPEAIEGLIIHGARSAANNNQLVNDSAEKKAFVKDFEPRPNVSAYHGDKVDLKGKPFVKDFVPRPNVSAYHDDEVDLKGKPFVKDFEPRPDVSAYEH